MFISGNELVVKAALDAGCNFFSGYPITPSSEVAEGMSRELPKKDGVFIQMEDEISGVATALGASLSGAKAMTATSGPGMSLKSEQLGFGYMAEIPLVVVNVMRGGPSTGLPTRVAQGDLYQAKAIGHGDIRSVVLYPGNLKEIYEDTMRAFNIAEEFMLPVVLLLDETIAHYHGSLELPKQLNVKDRAQFAGKKEDYKPYKADKDKPAVLNKFFTGYKYHVTGLNHGDIGFPTEDEKLSQDLIDRLFAKVDSHMDKLENYTIYKNHDKDEADLLLVAFGSVTLAAREAIEQLKGEVNITLFQPRLMYPIMSNKFLEFAGKAKKVLVCELSKAQYANDLEAVLKKPLDKLNKVSGRPLSPAEIVEKIRSK